MWLFAVAGVVVFVGVGLGGDEEVVEVLEEALVAGGGHQLLAVEHAELAEGVGAEAFEQVV